MAVFKCKMCGGTIEFEPGASVGVCDSCGTKQTLPRLDGDRKAALYERANRFRRKQRFRQGDEHLRADFKRRQHRRGSLLVDRAVPLRRRIRGRPGRAIGAFPTINRAQFTSDFCRRGLQGRAAIRRRGAAGDLRRRGARHRRASKRHSADLRRRKSRSTSSSATKRRTRTADERGIPCLRTNCITS